MKTKANQAIRELRKTIGQTQGEFAAMIGASKDAVASWETGRNKLSDQFARRMAFATGVDEDELLRGRGPLTCYVPFAGREPFTAVAFARYRGSYWGRSDDISARQHYKNCADALWLLFMAAALPGVGKIRHRLPGVLDSFIQWCQRTREDFRLEPQIEELLRQRKTKLALSRSYGQWRAMQKEDPKVLRLMGFKDNPRKDENEELCLETDTLPIWSPGHPMRGPK
jgi:transcriptional regulator with XRE-family HTH domain